VSIAISLSSDSLTQFDNNYDLILFICTSLHHFKSIEIFWKQLDLWLTRRSALVSIKLRASLIIAAFKKAIIEGAQYIYVGVKMHGGRGVVREEVNVIEAEDGRGFVLLF
jgi:hypothetical protein